MPPSAKTRRYQDLKIRYTTDYLEDLTVRQRVYKAQDGSSETPITSLLESRLVNTDCPVKNPSWVEFRNVVACFSNTSNASGQSEYTVIIPFNPGNPDLKAQIEEIKSFNGVLSIEYRGESISEDIEQLL